LGYSSLLMLHKKYRKKVNTISIINLLEGIKVTYNVEFINGDNCVNCIKLLTYNNMRSDKQC